MLTDVKKIPPHRSIDARHPFCPSDPTGHAETSASCMCVCVYLCMCVTSMPDTHSAHWILQGTLRLRQAVCMYAYIYACV